MPDHFVEVRLDENYLARLAQIRPITDEDRADAYASWLICSDPPNCPGWEECWKDHEVGGVDASQGPSDADCACIEGGSCSVPWCGYDEFSFHGELHEWRYGYGWTVPYSGCPAVNSYNETPDEIPLDRSGIYKVDVDWEDEYCYTTLSKDQ